MSMLLQINKNSILLLINQPNSNFNYQKYGRRKDLP